MPRLMSFAKTAPQFLAGSKSVTRRDGWRFLQPGDILMAVDKSPRSGGEWARLGLIEVVDVRREHLGNITEPEVALEGFPGRNPSWFLEMYLGRRFTRGDFTRVVNRIEFRRLWCAGCGRPAMVETDTPPVSICEECDDGAPSPLLGEEEA